MMVVARLLCFPRLVDARLWGYDFLDARRWGHDLKIARHWCHDFLIPSPLVVNGLRLNLLMIQTVLFPQSEIPDNTLASMVGDCIRLTRLMERGLVARGLV